MEAYRLANAYAGLKDMDEIITLTKLAKMLKIGGGRVQIAMQ